MGLLSWKIVPNHWGEISISGTAQKADQYGNYNGGYTGSYVAVAPAEDPQILVYVVIDEPVNGYYGGTVAFPTARQMMMQALPTRKSRTMLVSWLVVSM